jgi:uncharacterized protein YraI
MSQGIVTASSLNLRATPGGTIVASLPKGTTVEILENQGEWLQVSAQNRTGFVASQYVEGEDGQATTSTTVPPAAQPGDITVANGHAGAISRASSTPATRPSALFWRPDRPDSTGCPPAGSGCWRRCRPMKAIWKP